MTRSFLAVSLLVASLASAQAVPTQVSFTARLVDAGAPVQGNRDFIFRLFPTVVAGTEIWSETRNTVAVVDGAVNLQLGASTPLDDTIFDGQTLYLEVTVGGQVLTPRTPVVSVPYAVRSAVAGQVGSLTPAQIQQRVATACGAGAAIQAINADGTVVCAATGGANDAGVTTITNITAGAGLTGGGATGNVTLAVSYAGSGAAVTAARSDHSHTGTYLPLGPVLACTGTDKVVGLNGSGSVICAADTNTSYTALANGGLTLSGSNQFSLQSCALSQVLVAGSGGTWSCATPANVSSVGGTAPIASSGGATPAISLIACGAGQIYKMAGGVWTCSADNDVPYTGNAPVSVTGNAVSLTTCAAGQIYKMAGGGWACSADNDVPYTGNAPIAVAGSAVSLTNCGAGQIYKMNPGGTAWGCAADNDTPEAHLGDVVALGSVLGGGIALGGTPTNPSLAVDTSVQRRTAANPLSCAGGFLRSVGQDGTATCVNYAGTGTFDNVARSNHTHALSCSTVSVAGISTAAFATATCPAGTIVTGGGCNNTTNTGSVDEIRFQGNGFYCRKSVVNGITAEARCCEVN
ncbi:MAG: hypothetical protein Q8L48_05630 [Archangium sp.]|nr:hypothetical protein [Archangium sp.]